MVFQLKLYSNVQNKCFGQTNAAPRAATILQAHAMATRSVSIKAEPEKVSGTTKKNLCWRLKFSMCDD
jgi:hypothetical protein